MPNWFVKEQPPKKKKGGEMGKGQSRSLQLRTKRPLHDLEEFKTFTHACALSLSEDDEAVGEKHYRG